jgi:exosome complex RNA-binding protein Rrp42 (RNase PH superfamily)
MLSLRNLIDAANIAALAALSTFRRPECSIGGDDGQQVIVHDPEVDTHLQYVMLYIILLIYHLKSEHPNKALDSLLY